MADAAHAWLDEWTDTLIQNGEGELGMSIWSFSDLIHDGDYDRAEATYPSLIAEARRREMPWVEIYLTHWLLQGRRRRTGAGRSLLTEAVALVERAHQDDCRECPQAVCAVQDLSYGYELVDPVGYGEARLAVVDETIGDVSPSAICFLCLSVERVDTLNDLGRPEEAIEFAAEQRERMTEAGAGYSVDHLQPVVPLMELGRYPEALEALDKLDEADGGDAAVGTQRRFTNDCLRVRILAALGEHDQAMATLPDADTAATHRVSEPGWARAVEAVLDAGALQPDMPLLASLMGAAHHHLAVEGFEGASRIALVASRVAIDIGAPHTGAAALDIARRAAAGFVDPTRVDDAHADVEKQLAALPTTASPPDDLGNIDPLADPDSSGAWLSHALAAGRSDRSLLDALAAAHEATGRATETIDLVWQAGQGLEWPHDLTGWVADRLAADHDTEGLARLADSSGDEGAEATLIRELLATGRPAEARLRATAMLERGDDPVALELGTRAALATEEWEAGVVLAQRLAAAAPGEQSDRLMLLAATLAGHHDIAAETSARLPTQEGATLDAWYRRPSDGAEIVHRAEMISPVMARLIDFNPDADPDQGAAVGSTVVLDTTDAAGCCADSRQTARVMAVQESWPFDAAIFGAPQPTDAIWAASVASARTRGWFLTRLSDDDFTCRDPSSWGGRLPALTAAIAVPKETAATDILDGLDAICADWEHPPTCTGLAEAAGHDLEAHRARLKAYGF